MKLKAIQRNENVSMWLFGERNILWWQFGVGLGGNIEKSDLGFFSIEAENVVFSKNLTRLNL